MEAFIIIITGVLVFIISQYILRFVLEPIQELKKTITQVSFSLIFWANIYRNITIYYDKDGVLKELGQEANERLSKMREDFRILSCNLQIQVNLIPHYEYLKNVFSLPDKQDITQASGSLMGLSHVTFIDSKKYTNKFVDVRVNNIQKCLKFHVDV